MSEARTIGPFSLLAPLATGGMAQVWLARRIDDARDAAPIVLKTILPCYSSLPEFVAMFLNEAKVATRLDHPNIVRVYETGQADGCHYIAMEYITGRTLRQILWRSANFKRLFPVWFALDVAALVCDALEYLHGLSDHKGQPLRLLHRDVTPENLIVSFAGEVKLLDFGIARALSLPALTHTGTLKGKYAYMAPELVEVNRTPVAIDARSDLYSLGVVLYEALTGVRPYNADNDAQLLQLILDKGRVAEAPSHHAPWIPETLDRLVLKSISKLPEFRFQSARLMREAIRNVLKDTGLCPTARHIADQICGYAESAGQSSVPPSMRLQSPHEVALQLDSGCHAICSPSIAPTFDSFTARLGDDSADAAGPNQDVPEQVVEKTHNWDAAIRRVRSDELEVEPEAIEFPQPKSFGSGSFSAVKTGKREALELFDSSLELLRRHDIEGAISALQRAAQLEPDNRLINANLRRLEQLTELRDTAERRG